MARKKRRPLRRQTKKLFDFNDRMNNRKCTVVTLPSGNKLTVLEEPPKLLTELIDVTTKKQRYTITAKHDLVLTVTGVNGKNALCKKVLYGRADRLKENKKVQVPRAIKQEKHQAKALRRAGLDSVYFPGGLTTVLLYKGEYLVPDNGVKNSGWIIPQQKLNQYINAMRTPNPHLEVGEAAAA